MHVARAREGAPALPAPEVERGERVEIPFGTAGTVVAYVDLRWMQLTVDKMTAVRNILEQLKALGYEDSAPDSGGALSEATEGDAS